MKRLDILVRTVLFIIVFAGVFYIVPKIMIPDVIKDFKAFWRPIVDKEISLKKESLYIPGTFDVSA